MRTLIFSDTHLTPIFEPAQFAALEKLIKTADKAIINGDFWDGYFCTFSEFIDSQWSALFPLLLQKKTFYIYGNHDTKDFCDERVRLFSVEQALSYKLQVGGVELLICHGHTMVTENPLFHADMIFRKPNWLVRKFYRAFCFIRDNKLGLLTDIYWKYLRKSDANDDVVLQEYAAKNMRENQLLVCGHSHIQRDLRAQKYLNTGRFEFGRAEYVLIEDETIQLVTENYYI